MDSSLYGTVWFIYPNNHGFSVDHGWIPSESPSNIHLLPNRATNNSSLGIQGGSFRWNLHMVPKPAVSESAPKNGSIGIFTYQNFTPAIHALHNSYPCLLQKIFRRPFDSKNESHESIWFWTISWVTTINPSIHQSAQTQPMLLATSWSCLVAPRTAVGRTTAASADALARIFNSAKSRRRSKTSEEILSPNGWSVDGNFAKSFPWAFSETPGRGCLLHLLHVKKAVLAKNPLKTRGIPSLQTDFLLQKSLQLTKKQPKNPELLFSQFGRLCRQSLREKFLNLPAQHVLASPLQGAGRSASADELRSLRKVATFFLPEEDIIRMQPTKMLSVVVLLL